MKTNLFVLLILIFTFLAFLTNKNAHIKYTYIKNQLIQDKPIELNKFDKLCLKLNPHDFLLNHILKYQSFIYLKNGDKYKFKYLVNKLYEIEPNNFTNQQLFQYLNNDSMLFK